MSSLHQRQTVDLHRVMPTPALSKSLYCITRLIMTLQRATCEAVQVEIGAAIEARDAAFDQVEADVGCLDDREDLGRRRPWKEEGHVGERRYVLAAEAAGVAAGDGRSAQRRKRQGGADDAHIETPKVVFGENPPPRVLRRSTPPRRRDRLRPRGGRRGGVPLG